MRTIVVVQFLLICTVLAADLFGSHEYDAGDPVSLFINTMTSSKTQIPLDYYNLAVCKPDKVYQSKENIGSLLSGSELSNTVYQFKMMENKPSPTIVCRRDITSDEAKYYRDRIDDDYNVQWLVDELPAASIVSISDDASDFWYEDTYPIGYITEDGKHSIYNHLSFVIQYHKSKSGKYRIVGFRVSPVSIKYIESNGELKTLSKTSYMTVEGPDNVIFTYTVKFEESDTEYGMRWDLYLQGQTRKGVHWFSLTNSLFMALFLSTIVGIIMLRTLARDINKYNSISEEERLETVEEGGWKLIHGDVFRPPARPERFASLIGSGVQVFWTIIVVVSLAAFGLLSPANRGSIQTAGVILFIILGVFAGYASSRLYSYFGGKQRRQVTLMSGMLFPAAVGIVLLIMNILWLSVGSTQFIHFSTILKLMFLWIGISLPLVFVGSFFGYKIPKYHMPVRTNHIAREAAACPWYLNPWITCLVGGCVPFGTIFLEVYLMMSSMLLHQMYAVFGFLLAILVLTIITAAEISIVICYFQLASEDYNWWWPSFYNTASTAYFVFLFALYYMFSIGITKFVSMVLYLCLMLIACTCVYLACGTIGFYTCFAFTRQIYSSLKVD